MFTQCQCKYQELLYSNTCTFLHDEEKTSYKILYSLDKSMMNNTVTTM